MNASILRSSRAVAAAVALTLAATSTPSHAAAPEDESSAKSHFERGVGLFEDGDFASALFEFETAYTGSNNPHLLYNIAVSQYELHRYAAATRSYRRYLDALEDELPPPRVEKVKERLATLELRVGTLIVESRPAGAVVSSGGETLGVTPAELVFDLGEREIRLEKDGFESQTKTVRIVGGERSSVSLELSEALADVPTLSTAPAVAPRPAPAPDEDEGVAPDSYRGLRTGSIVVGAVGGLAGVGAIIAGSLAIGADRDLADELETETTPNGLDDLANRRDTLALTTDVLIGVTAAAAVTAVALGVTYVVKRKRGGDDRTANRARLQGLTLRF